MSKNLKSFLYKRYPDSMDVDIITEVKYIDTEIPTLNYVMSGKPLTGGLPMTGKITIMYGPEGCMASDVHISYDVWSKDGKIRHNHKGGTIENLYYRFHGIERKGKGYYRRPITEDAVFYVKSINSEDCIFMNEIHDVVKTGQKECFKVTLKNGMTIETTKDHKFYIGNGQYESLENLSPGSFVFIHNNSRNNKPDIVKQSRKVVAVKYHPSNNIKIVKGCVYCRVQYSHIVYEAYQNNLTPEGYINILNTHSKEYIDSLYTVPENFHIHHKDENVLNNNYSNLVLIEGKEHNSYHAKIDDNNLRFKVVPEQIVSIESVGIKDTYDIKCYYPNNNYIANKFVVHNCGKTSYVVHMIAIAQKKGIDVVYIDTERSITKPRLSQFGVDIDNLIYLTPMHMEECFDIIENICKEKMANDDKTPILIVWDSIAMTPTLAEIERKSDDMEIASQAGVLTRNLRRIRGKIQKIEASLLLINQARENQDRYGDIFKMPGGKMLLHCADIILRVSRHKPDTEGQDIKIGTPIKNRLFRPFQQTTIKFDYVKGFTKENVIDSFCEFLKQIGILGTAGAYCYLSTDVYKLMEEEKIDEREATKKVKKFYKKEFVDRLLADDEYYRQIVADSEEYVNKNISMVTRLMLDPDAEKEALKEIDNRIVTSKSLKMGEEE
jgi:RecA/RadA recombinase